MNKENELLKDFNALKKFEISPKGFWGGKQAGWTQVSHSTTQTYVGNEYAGTDNDPDYDEHDT